MKYPIATLENAIIERIRGAKPRYLRFVGSYGGELAGEWQAVIRSLPAVWVTFRGMSEPRAQNTARTRWRATLELSTIVAARNVRGESAGRHGHPGGHPAEVGTYQMINDVSALICLQDFGLSGVDYLRPGAIRTLFGAATGADALSVLAQGWFADIELRMREPGKAYPGTVDPVPPEERPGYLPEYPPEALPDLETLALRYWLKPPLDPESDPPSAEDRITFNKMGHPHV